MSRPKGSINKPKDLLTKTFAVVAEKEFGPSIARAVNLLSAIKPVHYDLTISIRAFRDGRFKGLWELSKLHNDGRREIVVDATSRQSVINMVNRQIMKMVIAA